MPENLADIHYERLNKCNHKKIKHITSDDKLKEYDLCLDCYSTLNYKINGEEKPIKEKTTKTKVKKVHANKEVIEDDSDVDIKLETVNKVYNENCITLLKSLPDKSVDYCFTSPPYNTGSKNIKTTMII